MLQNKIILSALCSLLIITSFIPISEAKLWELIIQVNVEKGAIHPGESVIVTGKIVDHFYSPVVDAEVNLRTGTDVKKTLTNEEGVFRAEFGDIQRIPGTYTINIIATSDGKIGLTSTEFHVNGEISPVLMLQDKLATDEAIKYLSANKEDFDKNPIGQMLYNHYHGLLEKLVEEKKKPNYDLIEKIKMEQERKIAEDLKEKAIEEFNPKVGMYQGYSYEEYIRNLNPEIRDIVSSQLNFTKNTFEEAQKLRDEIIANGGTYEEARQAYLDKISISKEELEQFNQEKINKQEEEAKNSNEKTKYEE